MKEAERILVRGLEDAESSFGLLEATLREFKMGTMAEVVRQMRIKTTEALARAARQRALQDNPVPAGTRVIRCEELPKCEG